MTQHKIAIENAEKSVEWDIQTPLIRFKLALKIFAIKNKEILWAHAPSCGGFSMSNSR